LEQLSGRSKELVPIKKLSTRHARSYEETKKNLIDIQYGVSKHDVSKCDYKYNYAGNVYGVIEKDISTALNQGKSPVVIIRSTQIIKELKDNYPSAIVVYIMSAYTGNDLKNILKKQGRKDIDIEERIGRHRDDLIEYIKNIELYDYVFANLYDDDSLVSQFDHLMKIEKLTTTRTGTLKNYLIYSRKKPSVSENG
jgi:ribose 1,5-bisphosphokinase PhnN